MSDATWVRDKRGWQVWDDGATYVLARRLPVRWDVSAQTRLPDMGRRRLAHAVRQDLWRRLQRLRGFAPQVSVLRDGQGLLLRAGGQVAGRVPPMIGADISDLLHDAAHRAAWARSAAHKHRGAT